uniref:Uncharacterized protein LOC113790656 n=1 Tax=Dermatophagoides pteronyssinus TaxID=6956 RepID=A0A6P6XTH3_DERPT|nr:uncharacterized protein LOC113790656 [Dermatophagoides pteronyssinus]
MHISTPSKFEYSHRSGHSIRFKDNLLDKSHNGKERKNLPKKSKKKQSPSKPKQKNKLKLNNNNNNKIDAKENYLTTMMTTKMTTEELGVCCMLSTHTTNYVGGKN